MNRYDHKQIESKWQEKWEREKINRADDSSSKPKRYILDMFPYPSGAGLHVGHVEGYTATDIYSRYLRRCGFEVLHPMGWDAFGLPAENYAIKTKTPPQETTDKAIENFRKQIKSLGLSYDWSREIGTHTPEYYKWTQWFFLLLYRNGLAYRAKAKVNWCPQDQTVLANEQVVNGCCERCGTQVIQKDLEQWFFKITQYADALLNDLDTVDWPESTKIAQRNWIGRSEGAEIDFAIAGRSEKIKIFTTRPDTLFGATYMVLAPEHPLVAEFLPTIANRAEVETYADATTRKTELERSEAKEKTGVELKGIRAINPANKKEIPVFIADYVLAHYGTGAIMAVPAHDERDFAFAKKFNVPVIQVVESAEALYTGPGILINSGEFDGLDSDEAKKKITEFVGGQMKTTYRLRDWLISRQRYWGAPIPMIYCDACGMVPVPEKDLPVLLPTDVDFVPHGESPLARSKSFHDVDCPQCGQTARRESDTMDTFVCSSWYFFRFTDPHNASAFAAKEKIEAWLPVDLYVGGAEHTVLHLLYSRFFTKVLNEFGDTSFNEPFAKLRHQGLILAEDGRKMSKSLGNVINPDDVIAEYGADALRLYEMFMGPLDSAKPWSTKNIVGVSRFLERIWKLSDAMGADHGKIDTLLQRTIQKVGDDVEALKFNTAISALMILLNAMEEHGTDKKSFGAFVQLLAPFAPHIAEELWQRLGEDGSVHGTPWPEFDAEKTVSDTMRIAIQISGKTRGSVVVPAGASTDEVIKAAQTEIAAKLSGKIPARTIIVPGRLVNFVLAED